MKLQRAEEHLGQLKTDHDTFIAQRNPYRMLPEKDPELGYKLWRVKIVESPPVEKWGSMAGDCVHSLRSALDHTAFALVRIRRPHEEFSEFPIFKDTMISGKPLDRTYPGKLPGVGNEVLAQVNWLQPYRRGGDLDPLWLVHSLDIIDKHRRLNVVHPAVLRMVNTITGGATLDFHPTYGPFEDGAVVARYKITPDVAGVNMKTEFAFDVTFGEGKPPISGRPVMGTLHDLLVYVGGVVARFDRFFS